jgi:hypothetical protein
MRKERLRSWNPARWQAQGERFLRMAGAATEAEAATLWQSPATPVHQRCLAAKALGFLKQNGPEWRVEGVEDDESPLGRARRHGGRIAEQRRRAEHRHQDKEEAIGKMHQSGIASMAKATRVLQDQSETVERRISAASILGAFRSREALGALIEALSEGQEQLSWMCMHAIHQIGSRRGARRLIDIARGNYPPAAREEAIYTLWLLSERRAEQAFIRISSAIATVEEHTRDLATEALGNTSSRHPSQRALAARLFDPSVSVRYGALCACSAASRLSGFLRRAVEAKLADPEQVDNNRVIADLAAIVLAKSASK